jgi:hypothetical protein
MIHGHGFWWKVLGNKLHVRSNLCYFLLEKSLLVEPSDEQTHLH